MEDWQLRPKVDRNPCNEKEFEVGGEILRMRIFAAYGQLDKISVTPIPPDNRPEGCWEGALVKIQIADRAFYPNLDELKALQRIINSAVEEAIKIDLIKKP